MSRVGTTYSTGRDSWRYGDPDGIAHIFLGPCPNCGARTFDYGGGWRCVEMYCCNSANNPAPAVGERPAWWLGGIYVSLDGNAWCAVHADFINLAESQAGFGSSPEEAVAALKAVSL